MGNSKPHSKRKVPYGYANEWVSNGVVDSILNHILKEKLHNSCIPLNELWGHGLNSKPYYPHFKVMLHNPCICLTVSDMFCCMWCLPLSSCCSFGLVLCLTHNQLHMVVCWARDYLGQPGKCNSWCPFVHPQGFTVRFAVFFFANLDDQKGKSLGPTWNWKILADVLTRCSNFILRMARTSSPKHRQEFSSSKLVYKIFLSISCGSPFFNLEDGWIKCICDIIYIML